MYTILKKTKYYTIALMYNLKIIKNYTIKKLHYTIILMYNIVSINEKATLLS